MFHARSVPCGNREPGMPPLSPRRHAARDRPCSYGLRRCRRDGRGDRGGRPMSRLRSPGVAAGVPRLMASSTSTRMSANESGTPAPVRSALCSTALMEVWTTFVPVCRETSAANSSSDQAVSPLSSYARVQVPIVVHDHRRGGGVVGARCGGDAAPDGDAGDDGATLQDAGQVADVHPGVGVPVVPQEGVRKAGVDDQLLGLAVLVREQEVGLGPAEHADVRELCHARRPCRVDHRGMLRRTLPDVRTGDQEDAVLRPERAVERLRQVVVGDVEADALRDQVGTRSPSSRRASTTR